MSDGSNLESESKVFAGYELGKCYVTRCGYVTGPLRKSTSEDTLFYETHILFDGNRSWCIDGRWGTYDGSISELDLLPIEIVKEYETPTLESTPSPKAKTSGMKNLLLFTAELELAKEAYIEYRIFVERGQAEKTLSYVEADTGQWVNTSEGEKLDSKTRTLAEKEWNKVEKEFKSQIFYRREQLKKSDGDVILEEIFDQLSMCKEKFFADVADRICKVVERMS